MVIKKITLALVIILSTSILIIACLKYFKRYDIKNVILVPEGFVNLNNMNIKCVFWESQISFFDSNGKCVFQSNVHDDEFIVKYKGDYYININKYYEFIYL